MIKSILILVMVGFTQFTFAQKDHHQQQVDLLHQQKKDLTEVNLVDLQARQAELSKKDNCKSCPLTSKQTITQGYNQVHNQDYKSLENWKADKERIEQILVDLKADLPANKETYGKYLQSLREIERQIQLARASAKPTTNQDLPINQQPSTNNNK